MKNEKIQDYEKKLARVAFFISRYKLLENTKIEIFEDLQTFRNFSFVKLAAQMHYAKMLRQNYVRVLS